VTTYATSSCNCPDITTGYGGKKPDFCDCGNRYLSPSQLRDSEKRRGGDASGGNGLERGRENRPHVAGADSGKSGVGPTKPRRKAGLKRSQPKRDWSLAETKKEEEGCCRFCKRTDRPLESAHILGREHDEPKLGADGWPLTELLVHPDRVVPACGPFPEGCHGAMHRHEVDVLQHLTLSEQLKAVEDAGSIEAVHIRLTAVALPREAAA
jgi:hypothetical protein